LREKTHSSIAFGRLPSGISAVGRANGANQIVIGIPRHRVIGMDGSLTGYGGSYGESGGCSNLMDSPPTFKSQIIRQKVEACRLIS